MTVDTVAEEDFWDDLLTHVRGRVLVPVVGPDVTTINLGGVSQPFTEVVGQRLAERFRLAVRGDRLTVGQAVDAIRVSEDGTRRSDCTRPLATSSLTSSALRETRCATSRRSPTFACW
jgi:hypothetical protein